MSQKAQGQINYTDYIQVDQLIDLQKPESEKHGKPVHDETLFIVVHQVYELWFKQILHELKSLQEIFRQPKLKDESLGVVAQRLERITKIQNLLLDQVSVLETMTPMDFLDFRNYLYPASGFQSFQFRLTENLLGLDPKVRLKYENQNYLKRLSEKHQRIVEQEATLPSIFILIESWLERTPFLQKGKYNFWNEYFTGVDKMLSSDFKLINENPHLNEKSKEAQLASFNKTKESFNLVRDPKHLEAAQVKSEWRLSFKATQAALFVFLYREQPALQLPFKILSLLVEIDENFTAWRHRHALMALKMIGTKIGTGGSSGFEYLQQAANAHRVFFDFSRLATFLIPKTYLPILPTEILESLGFQYDR
jgi:tryptophan 2,3-dioxygenase